MPCSSLQRAFAWVAVADTRFPNAIHDESAAFRGYFCPYKNGHILHKEEGQPLEISIDTKLIQSESEHNLQTRNRDDEFLALYDAGLNIAPAASARDARSLVYNRLARADFEHLLSGLFRYQRIYAALGHTSGHLFAVSCITHRALEFICRELGERGIARWAISPGLDGSGAGHLIFQCKDGYIPDQPVQLPTGDVVDIYGSGRCILLPPSIDPDGEVYRWRHKEQGLPPSVHLSELEWLGIQKNLRSRITDPWERMPPRNQAFLKELVPHAHETRLFAVAYEASASDIPVSEAVETLLPAARRNGLPDTAVYRAVGSAYSRECETAYNLAASAVDRGYAWIARHHWPPRFLSALIVACALLALYRYAQNGVFRAAYTQLQALTRLHPDTISRALKYLVEVGFVVRTPRVMKSEPARWRLGSDVLRAELVSESGMRDLADVLLWDTDARERNALGPVAILLYWRMLPLERPANSRELTEVTPFSRRQVDYALKKLAREPDPWVRKTDEGWIVVRRPQSLKEIPQWMDEEFAGIPGVGGKGMLRRERLHQKRSKWAMRGIERGLYRQSRGERKWSGSRKGAKMIERARRSPRWKRCRVVPIRSRVEVNEYRKQRRIRVIRLAGFFRNQARRI